MTRNDFLKYITAISGAAIVGTPFLLSGCSNPESGNYQLSKHDLRLLDAISETIIPKTDTVGALETEVPKFVKSVYENIFTEEEQTEFSKTLEEIEAKAIESYNSSFSILNLDQREAIINQIKSPSNKGFISIYQCVLFGYLTSKEGLTSTFNFVPVPGKYIADLPYKDGDKANVNLQFLF